MAMQQFAVATARPLPVIILADVSGSMLENNNIGALNAALKDFLSTLSQESRLNAEIHVSIITFGGAKAEVHVPLTPAWQINQTNDLVALGGTPMGGAFELAVEMIENKEIIPSRAYKPTIVLISDGIPTDNWESSFNKLKNSDRAQKASRMAMAIGTGADKNMLKAFVNDLEASEVFEAHNAKEIHRFFRAVSMSVSSRSQSNTPNQLPTVDFSKLPDDELDLSDF
ncbi:VWA domain-containing protein [Acinetobacter sp.]|uniref:vWA domain-containing protein n=1 Tax=Acinetobacter sp. TaxID=472 RepID=UPI0028AF7BFB|nr:VWA domain-containing protein [Acinetobacter sp.]MDV4313620.1 VWA domain-containing protein [Acinetobacter indicus]